MNYAILISGRGSNMQALLDAGLPGRAAVVLADRPGAVGLGIARERGVPTVVVDRKAHAGRDAFEAAIAAELEAHGADLVMLAGFMRILGDGFVERYAGRMLNIHPSLLPAFPGLDTHARALGAGVRIHGCTVHFVTPTLDAGPIVVQAAVPVLDGDDADTLAARVLAREHVIYPLAARWFLEGRLGLDSAGRAVLRGVTRPDAAAALIVPWTD
ncbi:MAG: phosphoribosylglycinamide formyltransferase [Rhodocyclaceae bacterium]|nr:phosphoribosylglycinamide formyltransferase [Rhodocyclaceae bacterium]